MLSCHFALASRVSITNNGYDNIVVAVSPSAVPKSQALAILDNIKVVLFLYFL